MVDKFKFRVVLCNCIFNIGCCKRRHGLTPRTNLLNFLLKYSTWLRKYGGQWESNSLVKVCQSSFLTITPPKALGLMPSTRLGWTRAQLASTRWKEVRLVSKVRQKWSRIFPFHKNGFFSGHASPPLPVKGFWEFLHFLNLFYLIYFIFSLF